MSASKKILPKKPPQQRHRVEHKRHSALELPAGCGKCEELEKENQFLKAENEGSRTQCAFWREQCEKFSTAEENHWRRRYASRHLEAQKLEGQLALEKNRVAELEAKLATKEAQLEKLRRKLFAPSSEKGPLGTDEESSDINAPNPSPNVSLQSSKKSRGGQRGTPRPGRRHHDHLPNDDEQVYECPESCCADCGEQWQEFGVRETQQVHVTVRAHRRKITRKRYQHFCKKKNRWVAKTACGPKILFPHSNYGISVWIFLLVGKYALHMALKRICQLLQQHQLYVPQGTAYAGFKRIHKLIKVLIAEIRRYSREDKHHWHIDDTGWKVFVVSEDKKGYGWYLWVFLSDDVCVFIISPSRARAIPKSHLENSVGVATSDRLQSNKKLGENVINSFCWVHERREFRTLAQGYPEIEGICNIFLELIGSLFHHNAQRLLHEADSAMSRISEATLKDTLNKISDECQKQLSKPNLHPELRRVCNGIVEDWYGLKLFFDIPSIPPDNNPAERALRGAVTGRKMYYGCHSEWTAEFTADMFTLMETLKLNNIDPTQFLTEYLQACADSGGKAPPNALEFLPWHKRPPPKT
jgi:transposase